MPVKGVDIATAKLKMCSLQESKHKDLLQMAREMELVMKPLSAYNNWAAFDKQESSSEDEKYVVVSQKADGKRGLVANGTTADDKPVNNVAPASAMAATSSSLVSRSAPKNPISELKEMCEKSGCKTPEYTIVEATKGGKRWQCTVSVTGLGPSKQNLEITETASQKQQAKTHAAMKMLEKVKVSGPPDSLESVLAMIATLPSGNRKETKLDRNSSDLTTLQPVSRLVEAPENVSKKMKISPLPSPSKESIPTPPSIEILRKRGIQKSPTQLLYEYGRKHKVADPIFAELPNNPITDFLTKVTFTNCTGFGVGKNKKDSKENASLDMLMKLKDGSTELLTTLKGFNIL